MEEEQNKKILGKLGEIVESARVIDKELKDVHQVTKGIGLRVIGQSNIRYRDGTIMAEYYEDGETYHINVSRLKNN